MAVSIEYCAACGYRRLAERMAEALRVAHGVEVELIPGADGAFEVRSDDRLVFSKTALERFPSERELVDTFASLIRKGQPYSASSSSSLSSAASS